MITYPTRSVSDALFDAARGEVEGYSTVNKFGRNPDVDTATVPEDVWDVGGLWVPPTQARVHNIASTDAADTAAGTGMRTVRVSGLLSWDTAEVSEDIILDGVTNVPTVNAYVIIHRKKGLTFGSGGKNAGAITATAVTDGTVTAQISVGKGQTLMAIYGVPSIATFYMTQWYISMNRATAAAASADMELMVNERTGEADSGFLVKHHLGLASAGSSHVPHPFRPELPIPGPAIIKVQVENVSANDTDISAGFDGALVMNN